MYDSTIPRRIRSKREERGLAAYQLARMVGISPSYLSMIESAQKLPSITVATRLAKVLRDDPELYRAWAESGDDPDLEGRMVRMEKMRSVQTPGKRSRQRSPDLWLSAVNEDITLDAESAVPPISPGPIRIPLLPTDGDPDDLSAYDDTELESIQLDRQLLPDDVESLFAYRAEPAMIERVPQLISPGDVVVLAPAGEGVDPAAVYAVRLKGRIVLARLVYHEPLLLLTASDPYAEPVSIEAGSPRRLARALAGVVVTTVRTWSQPVASEYSTQATPSLGRSGRLDDGNIVRDCPWKDKYGWRPVQRPEDMDYLDENPGTTIRFRLTRDGMERYVLEMNPDQWRQALGTYYEHGMWRQNGYIVAITKRKGGHYTEKFQRRWADHVKNA